jgi:DNA polymerase III epsilon subunit-like protein
MVNKSQQFYLDKGIPEYTAMLRFKLWLEKFNKPVFVGFNAPFDYGWINYEFHKMCGENPFGINALDIKAMWYGYKGGSGNKIEWRETTKKHIKHEIKLTHKHTHQALEDAIEQAELFNEIRRLFP